MPTTPSTPRVMSLDKATTGPPLMPPCELPS